MKRIVKIFSGVFFVFVLIIMLSIHFQGRSYEEEMMIEESKANEAFFKEITGEYSLDIKEHSENNYSGSELKKYLNASTQLSYDNTASKPITLTFDNSRYHYKASIIDTNTVAGYIPDPYDRRLVILWNEDLDSIKGSIIIPIEDTEELILAFDGKRIIK
jgi:hypothetical protein